MEEIGDKVWTDKQKNRRTGRCNKSVLKSLRCQQRLPLRQKKSLSSQKILPPSQIMSLDNVAFGRTKYLYSWNWQAKRGIDNNAKKPYDVCTSSFSFSCEL